MTAGAPAGAPLGHLATRAPLAAGVASTLFGLVMFLVWLLRGAVLLQVPPGSSAVQGNTAVCFVLVGLGLVALQLGWTRAARWFAGTAMVLAGVLFAQYLFDARLRIGDPAYASLQLGRIAPNAAIAFLMAGGALLLLAAGRWLFTAALLGSLTSTVAATAFLDSVVRFSSDLGWGDWTDIGLPTATGMTLLGLALAACALARQAELGPVVGPRRGALLAGVVAALVSVLFWYGLRVQERRYVELTLDQTSQALAQEIAARVNTMTRGVVNLARHGASLGWTSPQDWRADASLSVGALADFLWIEWIDADFSPRLMAAIRTPPPQVRATPASTRLWEDALQLARSSAEPVVAGPFQLQAGEHALRIFVPLKPLGAAEAYLGGAVSAVEAFSGLFDHVAPGYAVAVRCGGRVVVGRGKLVPGASVARNLELEIPSEMEWSLAVAPEASLLASQRSQLPELALLAGLVIAVLLGSAVWFGEMASRRAEQLQAAVAERTIDLERALGAERMARQEATEAGAAKDLFLSIMSHELRNPLGSMRTALEVLGAERGERGTKTRMLGILKRQVGQLGHLVDDLLDVSRLRSGRISLEFRPLDLTLLLRNVSEAWKTRCAETARQVEVVLPDHPVWIEGDPARLTQVVDNLMINATNVTHPGGRIEIRLTETPGGEAEVAVLDDGEGIAPEEIGRLFEPFFRSDRSRVRQAGGLGLGLAIFRGLVEAHGGAVEVSSAGLSRGAEFLFRLPCTATPEPALQPSEGGQPGRRRLLLIDDHQDSLDALGEMLRLQGHDVLAFVDGPGGLAAAKEKARQDALDGVICDLGLPVMDGYEIVEALRKEPSTAGLLVIALSGICDDASIRRAYEVGFDHHLTKPVDLDRLREILAGPPGRPTDESETAPPGTA